MRLVPLFLLAVFVTGCSVNPVTGKRQLNFYSEEDEVELGRDDAFSNVLVMTVDGEALCPPVGAPSPLTYGREWASDKHYKIAASRRNPGGYHRFQYMPPL